MHDGFWWMALRLTVCNIHISLVFFMVILALWYLTDRSKRPWSLRADAWDWFRARIATGWHSRCTVFVHPLLEFLTSTTYRYHTCKQEKKLPKPLACKIISVRSNYKYCTKLIVYFLLSIYTLKIVIWIIFFRLQVLKYRNMFPNLANLTLFRLFGFVTYKNKLNKHEEIYACSLSL